jgi:hypothetical protein
VLCLVVALGALTGACSEGGGTAGDGVPDTLVPAVPGQALASEQVRCLADAGSEFSPVEPEAVSCDDDHDHEEFELAGTDLDGCVATIAVSSDLAIVADPDDPSRQIVDDERVAGHQYTSVGDGVSCRITLAEPRRGALLG